VVLLSTYYIIIPISNHYTPPGIDLRGSVITTVVFHPKEQLRDEFGWLARQNPLEDLEDYFPIISVRNVISSKSPSYS
jgi:hypothetical protein